MSKRHTKLPVGRMARQHAADEERPRDLTESVKGLRRRTRLIVDRFARRLGRRDAVADSSGLHRLLTGAAVETSADDRLEHQSMASALASSIRDTPASESLGIALYGAWGQGKTTIGELLRAELSPELRDRRYAFVRIDAWKYAHEDEPQPLRRHFLIAAYEAAGLDRRARDLKRLFGAEFSGTYSRSGSPLRRSFRLTAWELFVVLSLAVSLLVVLAERTALVKQWGRYVAALGIGGAIVAAVVGYIRDSRRVTAKFDPFASVEEFDEQLTQLIESEARTIEQRPIERFIFFIDDLDRCHDKLVVEAIETLQAFFGRSRCVYIVAADRDQLRRAVREKSVGPARADAPGSAIPADESFLEKIFQVTVDVPPPFHATLAEYARHLVPTTALGEIDGEELDTVLYYLVHSGLTSPRHVRVILNEFAMALNAAERREGAASAHLGHRPLTANKALLAKFVVLRAHYPWFYGLLRDEPVLLLLAQERDEALALQMAIPEQLESAWRRVALAAELAAGELSRFKSSGEPEASEVSGDKGSNSRAVRRRHSELLLESLQGFLARTSATPIVDPIQVQEFIYLRGREEFERLPGIDGARYRQAIDNGNTAALEELAGGDSSLVAAALSAALTRLEESRGAQARNLRRSVLALVKHVDESAIQEFGKRIVDALYSDDHRLDEVMGRDDADALRRLMPFMGRHELQSYVDQGSVRAADDFERLATRTRELARPEAWASALRGVETDAAALKLLAERCRTLAHDDAALVLPPSIEVFEPVVTAPTSWIDGDVQVLSWDPSSRVLAVLAAAEGGEGSGASEELSDSAELEEYELSVPPELAELAELHAGAASVRLTAVADSGGAWSAVAIAGADGDLVLVGPTPPRVGAEVSEAAMSVLIALADACRTELATVLPLIGWTYPRASDWATGLRTVALAVRGGGATGATVEAALAGLGATMPRLEHFTPSGRAAVSGAALDVLGGLVRAGETEVRPHAAGLAKLIARLVPASDPAARERVAADMHVARSVFGRAAVFDAISSVLPALGIERVQIIVCIVEPVDRIRALTYYLLDMHKLERALKETAGEDESAELTTALLAYLERVESIAARRRTKRGQELLLRLPFIEVPTYAARVISLAARCELDSRPPVPFLAAAAGTSTQALADVCVLLSRTARTGDDVLDAVLVGIARCVKRKEDLPAAVDAYQRSLQPRVPRLEQHSRIAVLVDWRAAERVGGDALLISLLSSAVSLLSSDLDSADRRLRLAEAWSKASRGRQRQAGQGYSELLSASRTDDQLRVIVGSALRFFEEERPPDRQKMRKAAWDAIARLYRRRAPSAKSRDLLVRALDELEWEGTPSRPTPRRIRRILEP